ncbi:MAG: hypothetical protein PUP91_21320 [Rhizonema sp. PD37]|nr:hypothetical protein [Rhizonema sp. PD37]
MENRIINASLSTQNVTFKTGGQPASFEVTVVNGSDEFAAFQLEVLAAGASRSSGSLWYRLTPEVAAAKPPGGVTQFQIEIFDTPLPAFFGTINLTVRIFSPQLREERKLLVRLMVEPGATPGLLIVELPIKRFQVYPRNSTEIPVRLRNLSRQSVEAVIRFEGIAASWLLNGAERRLRLDPSSQVETKFECQPPVTTQAPSQDYPFVVNATSLDSLPTQAEGILEVLPIGFMEFSVAPQKQVIPSSGGWLPDWKSTSASFQLLFKNTSNLRQQVSVQIQGRQQRKFTYKVVPENADAGLGETTKVLLTASTKRPWIGFRKIFWLEVKPILSDGRLGSTDPATQTLELQVFPKIPLWWLLLAILALLTALILWLLTPKQIGHTDIVNAVRFSGDSFSVVSGSDDCTMRLWSVNGDQLAPKGMANSSVNTACNGRSLNPKGLLAVTDKPVATLAFVPKDQDIIAAGLASGEIQLWNVRTREQEGKTLKDRGDNTSDRVFALVFTEDSRNLFSAHGSGKVRLWKRPGPGEQFTAEDLQIIDLGKQLKYPIRSLALSQDESILVTAGNFKRVFLLNPSKPTVNQRQLIAPELNGSDGDYVWSVAFAPAPRSHILATSDNKGYIAIWDLDKCRVVNKDCEFIDKWQAAQTDIYSITFNSDGYKLISADGDGHIIAWSLTPERKLDREKSAKGKDIDSDSSKITSKINSIAEIENNQGSMVVSGGDDFQVRLHPFQKSE